MTSTAVWVDDMHCAACSNKIEQALHQLAGVEQVRINPIDKQVHVSHGSGVAVRDIIHSIEAEGFHPKLASLTRDNTSSNAQHDRTLLKRVGIAGICMAQIMMLQIAIYAGAFDTMSAELQSMLSYVALLFCLPVICYAAVPFFVRGLWQPLQMRTNLLYALNMDTPIASAMALAFVVSLANTLDGSGEVYFDSVAMFAFLMLATRYIDQRLRGRLAVEKSLLSSLPEQAQRLQDGKPETVNLADIGAGDRLWIISGSMIPADGQLVSPQASLDEALLTGEAEPVERRSGESVYAGTMNVGSGIEIIASHGVNQSQMAQMDQIATAAASRKPDTLSLTDTIARIFVPGILLLAAGTYLAWTYVGSEAALSNTLAVLIISCPCALSLAVPAAINAGLGQLRWVGVLVRNPAALEKITRISQVHFDKTGTLTQPATQLIHTDVYNEFTPDQARTMAAALQAHSPHPIAQAFAAFYEYPAADVQVVTGQGVQGCIGDAAVRIGSASFCGSDNVDSRVYLSVDEKLAARFEVDHPLRHDATSAIHDLKSLGLSCSIISGDQPQACQKVADALAINCTPEVDPMGKQNLVNNQQSLFVGDGLNDLIAMSSAPVSMATMETVDLVKSKADVLLMSSQLNGVVQLVQTGRRVQQIVRQNLGWALLYNLIAIPIAMSGLAPPWLAAAGMSVSSLLVLGNAMRVLHPRRHT